MVNINNQPLDKDQWKSYLEKNLHKMGFVNRAKRYYADLALSSNTTKSQRNFMRAMEELDV